MTEARDPEALLRLDRELASLSRRLVADEASGADARQEAWLAAFRRPPSEEAPRAGWLARALRFRVGRGRRDAALRREREDEAARLDRREASLPPDELLARQEVRLALVRAVTNLDEPYRQTIALRFFEGLGPLEIARLTGVPPETVRTRTRRGLDRLRAELDERHGGRAAWALVLVPGAVLTAAGTAAAASSLASSGSLASHALEGVLLVSGKTKIALAAAALVVVGATAWYLNRESDLDRLDTGSGTYREDGGPEARRDLSDLGGKKDSNGETAPAEAGEPETAPATTPEEETATDGTTGRLEITVVYASGGVARDLPVNLLPFGPTDPFFRQRTLRTDENGKLVADPWPVGRTLAMTPIGGQKRIPVRAGETTVETLEIAAGTRIFGVVRTEDGSPVPGAEIIAADMGSAVEGAIAHADASGRYELPSFAPDQIGLVGARTAGRLPSAMVMVMPSVGHEKELDLVLGGPSGRLLIEVVDLEGRPVPGAVVEIEHDDFDQFRLPSGDSAMDFKGDRVLSDAAGVVDLPWFPARTWSWTVRAEGLAPKNGEIAVTATGVTRHRVVLGPGGIVTGIVLDGEGRPVEKAEVTIGQYGSVSGHYRRTDAEGRFRFEDVAPGKRAIRAERDEVGRVQDEIVVVADEERRWEGRLDAGARIAGVVVDESGNPVAEIGVRAEGLIMKDGGAEFVGGFARTDERGRFEISGLRNGVELDVSVSSGGGLQSIARQRGVLPGGEPLRLVVDSSLLGVAVIVGRLVDADGKPVGGAQVSASHVTGGGSGIHVADGEGRFRFEKLTPGEYRFWMSAPAYGHQRSGSYRVAAGEELDVGDVRFATPGRIEITLDDPDGLARGREIDLWAGALDGQTNLAIRLTGPVTLSEPIAPGRYRIRLGEEGLADTGAEVRVSGGETAPLVISIRAARTIRVELAFEGEALTKAEYRIVPADGTPTLEGTISRSGAKGTVARPFRLAGSRGTLEFEDARGRKGRLVVDPTTPDQVTVTLR
ncbi:MAG: sigma-70 family RNA polymerase sigma factor [Planctomycetota bacterium]